MAASLSCGCALDKSSINIITPTTLCIHAHVAPGTPPPTLGGGGDTAAPDLPPNCPPTIPPSALRLAVKTARALFECAGLKKDESEGEAAVIALLSPVGRNVCRCKGCGAVVQNSGKPATKKKKKRVCNALHRTLHAFPGAPCTANLDAAGMYETPLFSLVASVIVNKTVACKRDATGAPAPMNAQASSDIALRIHSALTMHARSISSFEAVVVLPFGDHIQLAESGAYAFAIYNPKEKQHLVPSFIPVSFLWRHFCGAKTRGFTSPSTTRKRCPRLFRGHLSRRGRCFGANLRGGCGQHGKKIQPLQRPVSRSCESPRMCRIVGASCPPSSKR